MKFTDIIKSHKQKQFVPNKYGLHEFGGEVPNGFEIPENEFLGGFQYLGKISKKDKFLEWLPFDLNLICPIFTDFDAVYLDYTTPTKPLIIYPANTYEITSAYQELRTDSKIVYKQSKFSLKDIKGINEDNEFEIFGIAGKPQPYFEDEPVLIPRCPKTNKKMKFVAQLFSNDHIEIESKNFSCPDEYEENLFRTLNFWCDGSLLIFIEPSSKVIHYSISNT